MAVETEERVREDEAAAEEEAAAEQTAGDESEPGEAESGIGPTLALAGVLGLAAAGLAAYLLRRGDSQAKRSRDEPEQGEDAPDAQGQPGDQPEAETRVPEAPEERREPEAESEAPDRDQPDVRERPPDEPEEPDESKAAPRARDSELDEKTAEEKPGKEPAGGDGLDEGNGGAADVLRRARERIAELTGRDAESVSALERVDGGWKVRLELVEVSRIPSTTDVLASYELQLDDDGEVVGYSRGRRYHRSQADEEGE